MTRLASILTERKMSYSMVAERAHLQARTVRQLATGETPIDNVAVGTVRRIAAALSLPVGALLDPDVPHPGHASQPRVDRLSAAIKAVMWPDTAVADRSPVGVAARDDITDRSPGEFFADMPVIDARRG